MLLQQFALFVVVLGLSTTERWTVNAFTVNHNKNNRPAVFSVGGISFVSSTSTCLRSSTPEGGGGEEESTNNDTPQQQQQEQQQQASGDNNDILNSAAFMRRKVEVLKSDIAKAEEEMEAAKAQVEAGKAEWGPQLDELQREVSVPVFVLANFERDDPVCGFSEAIFLCELVVVVEKFFFSYLLPILPTKSTKIFKNA